MSTLLNRLLGTSANVRAGNEDDNKLTSDALLHARLAGLTAEVDLAKVTLGLNEVETAVNDLNAFERNRDRLNKLHARCSNLSVDGLTRREAQFLADEADAIHEEIGSNQVLVLPANEDFGSTITAKYHTQAAIESSDNGAQKVWSWIMDMIKKLKDMILTWWDKFFGNIEGMIKYADKVKAAAEKYKDDKENKKITIKGKTLYVGTTAPTAASIASGIDKLDKTVPNFIEKLINVTETACDALASVMDDAGTTDTTLKAAFTKLGTKAAPFVAGTGITLPEAAQLMGGKGVELVTPEAPAETIAAVEEEGDSADRTANYTALAKVHYKVKGETTGEDKTIDIPRLGKDDVISVADSVKSMGESLLSLRKSRQDARSYADKIEKAAGNVKRDAEKLDGDDKSNKSELIAISKAGVNLLTELTAGAVSGWTLQLAKVGNAALKVAEASI